MAVIQSTQDNRISAKTICSIDLSAMTEAKRFHSDPEVKDEAGDLINRAFSIQGEVHAFTERLKVETIAEMESKWADALMLKNQLEDELKTLNLKTYEFTAEAARIQGRAQQASTRLNEHLAGKKKWVEALLLPKDRIAWEMKRSELQNAVDASRNESTNLQREVNCHNEDLSKIANRIRTATADALYLYSRINRLKGSAEPIHDPVTGLAS